MYDEKLEQLIDAALADGELTEKEKQVLFKKAQALGVDLDEFEMVLDARLVKSQKAEQEKAASSAPKSNKFGDVKKCPACGALVQSYQGVCPECGYAFEGVEANAAVKELSNLLQKEPHTLKMIKIIDNYPIPLDKASLLSFITWIRPQCTDANNPLANSYYKKYAECINKIKVSFADDKDLQPFVAQLAADEKIIRKQKINKLTLKNVFFWIGLICIIVLILLLKPKPLSKNPEKTNAAIIEAIEKGDLKQAENLYLNFKEAKSEILSGKRALSKAFIDRSDIQKAAEYGASNDELLDVCLGKNDYEEADKYGSNCGSDKIEKIIIKMCENGEKEKAKKYLESKKYEMKDCSERFYGRERGKQKYNDRINQINSILNSY